MDLLKSAIFIAIAGNLILSLVNYSECHSKWTRSTCTDDIITKWNKKSVGENLKQWITSISEIRSIPEKEEESIFVSVGFAIKHFARIILCKISEITKVSFLSNTVFDFETKNQFGNIIGGGVYYISNIDCSNQRNVGPKWRKASMFSRKQFDDGFLYSNEDDNGVFTGLCSYTMNIYTISEKMNFG